MVEITSYCLFSFSIFGGFPKYHTFYIKMTFIHILNAAVIVLNTVSGQGIDILDTIWGK